MNSIATFRRNFFNCFVFACFFILLCVDCVDGGCV